MRTLRSASVLVWVVASVVLGATCDRGGGHTQTEVDGGYAAGANGAVASDSELMETRGEDCRRDSDCSGYLRCIDSTCQVPPAVDGQASEGTPAVRVLGADDGDIAEFHVELATTAAERARGLMYRREMADGWGMLFVYPTAQTRSFYMKNTLIPLDMVFVDGAGRVVNVIERAEPMTLTPRPSEKPARYVLELNGGAADDHGIEAGMRIELVDVPDSIRPTP